MALATHQLQGSYAPPRPSWKRGIKSTQNLATVCTVRRTDIKLLKHNRFLCVDSPFINGSYQESSKISSFKGHFQSNEYKGKVKGSKSAKYVVKISCISQDNEETLSGLPKVQNITKSGSLAIYKFFKSWLTFLPLDSRNQDETLKGLSENGRVKTDHKLVKSGILETVWCSFLNMDAKIKIPAIIFIPLFLTINIKYGPQVVNELIPLWIFGPLLVSLYIKTIQVIYSLYILTFKKSVSVVNNLSFGKSKESLLVRLWQRVVDFKNLDYNYELKRIWEEFRVWLVDKCLDYVESTLSYRKMIGVLKMVKIV